MRELSLFSGCGGGLLGSLLLGWRTIGYVEQDPFCQRVIAARIADGSLEPAPLFRTVEAFVGEGYAERYRGVADVVTAGFPCQPFSVAGKRAGADDERNGWPATAEVLGIVRPRFAWLENVPGLLSSGYFDTIIGDLAALGFDAEWTVLGADDVGAPHRRERLWILAWDWEQLRSRALSDAERDGLRLEPERGDGDAPATERRDAEPGHMGANMGDTGSARRRSARREGVAAQQGRPVYSLRHGDVADTQHGQRTARLDHAGRAKRARTRDGGPRLVADADDMGREKHYGGGTNGAEHGPVERRGAALEWPPGPSDADGWRRWLSRFPGTEPAIRGGAHGLSRRVDRLHGLGNSQVPLCMALAFRILARRAGWNL